MKSAKDSSVRNGAPVRPRSRLGGVLLGTTALATALLATSAFAQDAAPADAAAADTPKEDTVVVVTGIRGALQSAATTKRKAATFVDSITASDVAALPDLSVAEALQRVPGVSVTRFTLGGSPDFPSPEGRGNLIRGLGFVRSEFNGRDAFSANGGRALDWSSIPPQLVGAVDVYKNSSADLIEGGIGGTINLRTLEPFDRKGYFASVSADFNYGDLAKKWSPSYNAVISNRWQTSMGEFGLMGGYSTSNLKSMIHGWQQPAPIPRGPNTGNPLLTNEPASTTTIVPGKTVGAILGFQMRTNEVERDRDSTYLAAQWKNDTMRLTGKYVRVVNESSGVEYTLESFPAGGNNQRYSVTNATFDNTTLPGLNRCNVPEVSTERPVDYCETQFPIDGGLMTSGLVTNDFDSWVGTYGLGVAVLGIGRTERTTTDDLSLNFKWRPTDRLYVEMDVHKTTASATSNEMWGGSQTYANAFIVPGLDNPQVTLTADPRTKVNPGNIAGNNIGTSSNPIYKITPGPQQGMNDPNSAFWLYAGEGHRDGKGQLTAAKIDVQYDFEGDSWFKSVKFGARRSERSQVNKEMEVNWGSIAPAWEGTGLGIFSSQATPAYNEVDFKDFYRGGVLQGENTEFLAIRRDLLLDPVAMRDYVYHEPTFVNADGSRKSGWRTQLGADGKPNYDPARISEIVETTTNAYLMMNFGKEFDNGMSIDGNFGVRYTTTNLASEGFMAYRSIDQDQQTAGTVDAPRTPDAESHDAVQDYLPETTRWLCPALPAPPAAGYYAACPSGQVGKSEARTVEVKDDAYWLPSFNVKWNLNQDMLIRFGYSKNLSRPNVQDMRAGQQTSAVTTRINYPPIAACTPVGSCTQDPLYRVDRGAQNITLDQIRVTGGNPFLKPTTAVNYDLSYEWYFQGGMLSTAVFKKDLENIIQGGDLTLGSMTLDGKTVNVVYGGPVNADEANLQGIELAYQQFYDFLPGWMSHLGLQANFTYIESSATPPPAYIDANGDGTPDDFGTIYRFGVNDLLGQSKYLLNVVGIYQDDKWEARLAYNWRSENLVSYRDYITGDPIYYSDSGFLDGSLKYNINRQVQISLNASNLLDTKNKAEAQIDASGRRVDRFSFLNDRRFVFSVRYQH